MRYVSVGHQVIRASRVESLVAPGQGKELLMKTDELIDMLGTNIEPVKDGQLRNTLLVALAMGTAVALCLMVVIFGAPGEAFGREYLGLTALALAFTLGLVAAGASFLIRAARPGKPG